ncbi:FAD-binding protein [Nocardiopsis mangrovi]|uniref:FAD-binding protein n=1 Tax=Nocardiopsis mangrovi TaxID=1179818 RepID=A0ABV9DVQ9_9ACTN
MSEHTPDLAHGALRGAGPGHDVVVIGGGAAGLSGALTLARARRSVLVVDAGRPRNAPAARIHGYLGREGTPPGEMLAAGRSEVAGYGGRIVEGEVAAVERGPLGDFDLVCAHFLHRHGDFPRDRVLRAGARAVAPGGVLLVVGHAVPASWAREHRPDVSFPTADEVLAALELAEGEWEVLVSGEVERVRGAPDGHPGPPVDAVLKVRRRPGRA